jgi:hypothetical protein
MTPNRPAVEDSYATALRAIRLMDSGSRRDFDTGSNLLASLGEEAVPVLTLMCRELVNAAAVLADRDRAEVLDHMAVRNIELAEGLANDDDDQG